MRETMVMLDSGGDRLPKQKRRVELRTVDGESLEGWVFVSQGQRAIDVLNLDNRFIAFEHADGAIEIFNKAVIGSLKPLESAVETPRQFAA